MTGVGGRPEVIIEGSNSPDSGWKEEAGRSMSSTINLEISLEFHQLWPLISLAWTGRCGLRLWAATSTTPGLFTWSTDWWLDSERSWSWSSTIHSPTNRQSSSGPSSTTTTLQDKPRKINGTQRKTGGYEKKRVNISQP